MNIELRVGVKALISNHRKKYLLIRRSVSKYPEVEGRWDIPGGRIIPGTDLVTNLSREVCEETMLKVTGTPKLIYAQDILRNPNRHIVRLTFTANASGRVKVDHEENDDFCWLTWAQITSLEDVNWYFKQFLSTGFRPK